MMRGVPHYSEERFVRGLIRFSHVMPYFGNRGTGVGFVRVVSILSEREPSGADLGKTGFTEAILMLHSDALLHTTMFSFIGVVSIMGELVFPFRGLEGSDSGGSCLHCDESHIKVRSATLNPLLDLLVALDAELRICFIVEVSLDGLRLMLFIYCLSGFVQVTQGGGS
ncbi:hypothetical protein Dimus_028533 [Dionaea muscipula]